MRFRHLMPVVMLVLLLIPLADATAEIRSTLYLGRHFGDLDFPFWGEGSGETEEGPIAGLNLEYSVRENLFLVLDLNNHESELQLKPAIEQVVFRPLDFDVTNLHLGLTREWKSGRLRPYLAVTTGASRLAAENDIPFNSGPRERWDRFSAALGAGVLARIIDRLSLRFDARILWIDGPAILDGDHLAPALTVGLTYQIRK